MPKPEMSEVRKAASRYMRGTMSRRDFMRVATLALGAGAAQGLLAACTPVPADVEVEADQPAESAAVVDAGADAAAVVDVELPADERLRAELANQVVDTGQWKKEPPWKLAFVTQGKTNSWVVMYDAHVDFSVQERYKGLFSDFFYGDAQGDADKQLDDFEDAMAWGPDLMMVSPMGQAALAASVDRAWDQGMPIIFTSARADTDNFISWIEASNYRQGALFAEWLAKEMDYEGGYIALSGIAGISVAEDRLRGARDVLKKYPDIQELGQAYCDWSPVKGKQSTEAFIAAHGTNIKAIWSDSGLMTMGAMEAFAESGMDIPPCSGEDLNGFLRKCKEYDANFIAVNYPVEIGSWSVDAVVDTLMGVPVRRYVDVPVIQFGYDELNKYFKPDYSDDLWTINKLPDEWIEQLGFAG